MAEPGLETRYSASRAHSPQQCTLPIQDRAVLSSAFKSISPCSLLHSEFLACTHFLTKENNTVYLHFPLESTPSVGALVIYCLMYDYSFLCSLSIPLQSDSLGPWQSSMQVNSTDNHSLRFAFQQSSSCQSPLHFNINSLVQGKNKVKNDKFCKGGTSN